VAGRQRAGPVADDTKKVDHRLRDLAEPGVVRRWTTAKAFTDEVSLARLYGGIHYRSSMVVGQAMGRQIGELAVQRYLKPVR